MLDVGKRANLLAQQHRHNMLAVKFTDDGVFLYELRAMSYERELVGFQFRHELSSIEATAEDAELKVAMVAEELTARHPLSRGIVQVTLASTADVQRRQQEQWT